MAAEDNSYLEISMKSEEEVLNKLNQLLNSDTILSLKINNCEIAIVNQNLFNGFENLIRLDLSNNLTYNFSNDVFKNLIHLEQLELMGNVLNDIPDNLFATNVHLKHINFSNNLLRRINARPFLNLKELQTLDFSLNHIDAIPNLCVCSESLTSLNLSFNRIRSVSGAAFFAVRQLTHLMLNNNAISKLNRPVFLRLENLEHLQLDNNDIEEIPPYILHYLKVLQELMLQKNHIKVVQNFMFLNNRSLVRLNLIDNKISVIRDNTFSELPNLRYLSVMVYKKFELNSIRYLNNLTTFELTYKGRQNFDLGPNFVSVFDNKPYLRELILILQKFNIAQKRYFSSFKNLTYFHIECLEPDSFVVNIDFATEFRDFATLETLSLKRLNYFTVSKSITGAEFMMVQLKYLDLTGIKNTLIDGHIFQAFVLLEYLNISFSEVSIISNSAFSKLANLTIFIAENSKLTTITQDLFTNNPKLKILNFAHCSIETIDDFSFSNLARLEILDLRNNYLLELSANTFFGLNSSVYIYVDDNSIADTDDIPHILNEV